MDARADGSDSGPADAFDDSAQGELLVDTGPSTLDFPLDQAGPYPVGYRTFAHTYTPLGVGSPRTIDIHVWYPADPDARATGKHPRYLGLFLDEGSTIDAPLAPPVDGTSYPVHLHSHGHQGFAGTSASMMRYFASHGWIAVSPDHAGDLLTDTSDAETVAHFLKRPQDSSAALDALATSIDFSLADTNAVLLSGHSRGSYNVWALAGGTYDTEAIATERPDATAAELAAFADGLHDVRVVAAIPMAGTFRRSWFGDSGYASVSAPLLALTGSEDNPSNSAEQWTLLGGTTLDMAWADIAGACHQTFALGTCNTLESELGFSIVNTLTLAFGRAFVLGDDTARPIALGQQTVSSKVTFRLTPALSGP